MTRAAEDGEPVTAHEGLRQVLLAAEPVAGADTRLWTGWCSSCCAGDTPLQPQPHQGRRPAGQELEACLGFLMSGPLGGSLRGWQ